MDDGLPAVMEVSQEVLYFTKGLAYAGQLYRSSNVVGRVGLEPTTGRL